MAAKKAKKTEAGPSSSTAAAPAVITKKAPEGWVDQLLAKMDSEKLDALEAKDPAARRFVEKLAKRRESGDRDITAAELAKIHAAGVAVGLRKAS